MTTAPTSTSWPDGVIARYLTVVGAVDPTATVDVETLSTIHEDPYATRSTCGGCGVWEDFPYDCYGNYREHSSRAESSESDARKWAQAHAEKCRALPRPTTKGAAA